VSPNRLSAVPAIPRAGTLFRVRVVVDSSEAKDLRVTIAGEALHFRARGDTLEAFAAVPVDSSDGVTIEVACDTAVTPRRLSTTAGNYRLEKLAVAPQFGTKPDSAIAARMAREAARSAEVSRAAHETPQLWTDAFAAPRESRITSGFGNGRTFNGQVTSRHTGTDYAGAVGAPVRAINRGVVRIVDAFYLGGNVVYIDHGAGMVSAYLHLSRQTVSVGDTVSRGQQIGNVGATGRVTGPHLHLITRFGLVSVDGLTVIGSK
jgi:murein DD-endopeptidase MepM/ murein hydrolase activator NlpD